MDCSFGTCESSAPTKSNVGVLTLAADFSGDSSQYTSIGAFFSYGVPPNHSARSARVVLCAKSDTQSAAPAPDDAALNRSVMVINLFVRWPPALQPIATSRSGS